jgi:hypothetical protein
LQTIPVPAPKTYVPGVNTEVGNKTIFYWFVQTGAVEFFLKIANFEFQMEQPLDGIPKIK